MSNTKPELSDGNETGNILEDLGFPDAFELDLKVRLAVAINKVLHARKLTQKVAAGLLGVSQPKISALQNYKLEGFSVERLLSFATGLGYDVIIHLKPRPVSKGAAQIKVVRAA